MLIVNCPHCGDEVRAPADADERAEVRCPLCKEEFVLGDALGDLPPLLEIVSTGHQFTTTANGADGGFDFGEKSDSGGAATAVATTSSTTSSTTARTSTKRARTPQRPQKSMGGEMVKIIGGGVVGVTLAILILWWGFRKDPFQLGAPVSRIFPAIVPAELRGGAGKSSEENGDNVGNFSMDSDIPFGAKPNGGAAQPRPPQGRINGGAGNGGAGNGGGADPPKRRTQTAPDEARSSGPQFIRVNGAPEYSSQILSDAIKRVDNTTKRWVNRGELSSDERNSVARAHYRALANLGESVTFVSHADAENVALVGRVKTILKKMDVDTLETIGAAAESWLAMESRESNGVALYGIVSRIEQQGEVFETLVKLKSVNQRRVGVLSSSDPTEHLDVGAQVIILGSIVKNPVDKIPAYRGLAPLVVVGGLPVSLPKPTSPSEDDPQPDKPDKPAPDPDNPQPPQPDKPAPPQPDKKDGNTVPAKKADNGDSGDKGDKSGGDDTGDDGRSATSSTKKDDGEANTSAKPETSSDELEAPGTCG